MVADSPIDRGFLCSLLPVCLSSVSGFPGAQERWHTLVYYRVRGGFGDSFTWIRGFWVAGGALGWVLAGVLGVECPVPGALYFVASGSGGVGWFVVLVAMGRKAMRWDTGEMGVLQGDTGKMPALRGGHGQDARATGGTRARWACCGVVMVIVLAWRGCFCYKVGFGAGLWGWVCERAAWYC